jgi:secreted PhoX family phosphatase
MAMSDDRIEPEDIGVARPRGPAIDEVAAARLGRRALAAGAASLALTTALPASAQRATGGSSLTFREVPQVLDQYDHVAVGYRAEVLLRWGDPVEKGAPPFDHTRLDGAAQAKQFGYNCDFIAFMPLPRGSRSSTHGLLCVNHEYTNTELMYAGFKEPNNGATGLTRAQMAIDQAAHGLSVVEIRKSGGRWRAVRDSALNRRFTAGTTRFRLAGPVAGHARVKTSEDATGLTVIGTLNNCAGGKTPWGTVLSGEENFNGYFLGDASKTPEAANHRRYGVQPWQNASWGRHERRFDVEKEPNEPNRFGWVVEFDPYDPKSAPVKRTALGRFKHEGATCVLAADGRVAVYSADDERFEYVYRFLTRNRFDPRRPAANRDLLDEGTLSVARLDDDGTLRWLPLVHGQGPLTAANGFFSQADVLIEARRAADLVGATPMDRPEDVEANPASGRVYVVMTYNDRRKPADDPDQRQRARGANPRANNRWGHIVEMIPPSSRDRRPMHEADAFRWEIFLQAGNPAEADTRTQYGPGVTANGWLAAPDNIAFDPRGRIWIATDGMPTQARPGYADGIWGADTSGPGRAVTRRIYATPRGAEACGPEFTPDGRTLFVSVQHPGEERGSTYDTPSTRWPDFAPGAPPRPSIVAITRLDGKEIGG